MAVNPTPTMVTVFPGDPNGVIYGNEGDVISDPVTPAIWVNTGSEYSSTWTNAGGGGGSFPDYTGVGSPQGVVSASAAGKYYEDTDGYGGLFISTDDSGGWCALTAVYMNYGQINAPGIWAPFTGEGP